jgi:hypothetical protein
MNATLKLDSHATLRINLRRAANVLRTQQYSLLARFVEQATADIVRLEKELAIARGQLQTQARLLGGRL